MTEADYIAAIRASAPEGREIPPESLELVERALLEHPNSSQLWLMRGNLIQLSGADNDYELSDARSSYERAIEVEPDQPEPHVELGYYLDVIDDDYPGAEKAFRAATERGCDSQGFLGLARVMAEQGRAEDAIKTLDACPFSQEPELLELREEILSGMWNPE